MSEDSKPSRWSRIGSAISRVRIILSNIIFFGALLFVLLLLFPRTPTPEVPEGGALVLDPRGVVVEQRSPVDPIGQLLVPTGAQEETELSDILDALEYARADNRISMLVLDLDDLQFITVAHADAVGEALRTFRESGKQVVAYGTYYDQQHYLMASFADAIYMHPLGQVLLPGYESNQLYFKGLIDKLKVDINVFQAGTYKEFVEPYLRTDMSEPVREANRELVHALWDRYSGRILENRRIAPERFERYTQAYDEAVAEANGNVGRAAIEYHLVDELLTPDEARVRVGEEVGYDSDGDFNAIGFRDYLRAVNGPPREQRRGSQIGVITAQGPVVMGQELRGVIAAEQITRLIRQAREDARIGALVVRMDTPGGSVVASELIRQELELTQLMGKPVVISMGPVAASGGYWIASTTDAIFAEPSTLTGSIGVFGIIPTFEHSLAEIGITVDGVKTSEFSGINLLTTLPDSTVRVMQSTADHMYERFVSLVARGRDMSPEDVEVVAQGRVWLGARALELGLVDSIGGLDAAIARAAELAELTEFGVRRIEPPTRPRDVLLRALAENLSVSLLESLVGRSHPMSPLMQRAGEAWRQLQSLNDPRHSYAICMSCSVSTASMW
ncbi:MAG: signal peptide peptidase SppA [Pseudomonadales bacterium]